MDCLIHRWISDDFFTIPYTIYIIQHYGDLKNTIYDIIKEKHVVFLLLGEGKDMIINATHIFD